MILLYTYGKNLAKFDIKDFNKTKGKTVWVDAFNINDEEAKFLRDRFKLHPLTVEDLINPNTRIKVEEFPNYIFAVFYGVKKSKKINLHELDFIIGDKFIITVHKTEAPAFTRLKNNPEKLGILLSKGPDFVFHKFLDMEIDNFAPVLESIDDEIEALEESVTKGPSPKILSEILGLKRTIIHIKKIVLPQREKISFLAKNDYKFLSKKSIPYFRDIYDHAIRVADTIDTYREAISNSFDIYMSAVSNNMNEVMKTLSIIATIALPLGVISGIYGTNFDLLPGQHISFGFWIMISLMVAVSGIMIYYFKRRRWF